MRIFISYAREQSDIADRIAVGLKQEGYDVFFDRDDLPPGEGYDREIRRRIRGAQLFICLVSPDSLDPKSYAVTELDIARRRWPDPSGSVLPVLVAEAPWDRVPGYLSSVTVLKHRGNLTADVLARVEVLARKRQRRILIRTAIAAALVAAAVTAAIVLWPAGRRSAPVAEPCSIQVAAVVPDGSAPLDRGDLLVYVGGAENTQFMLPNGSGQLEIKPSQLDSWTIEVLDTDGIVLGKEAFDGCPQKRSLLSLSESVGLVLEPR